MGNIDRIHPVEILAPGGSYESVIAAMNSGADAIYTGGGMFGARAYADNLTQDKLIKIIEEAHLRHKKIYLTVNTLLKEKELQTQLVSYLKPYYEAGLDAVLVQDFGVLSKIREVFPDLPIHASTQMTVLTPEFSKWLKTFGVTRVVPARELSLKEIRKIKNEVDIEVETFVHGALCYCYSGQCLMSSILGGRSGNRGRCAQPCRLPYQFEQDIKRGGGDRYAKHPAYILSLNDLCTLELIPDMVDAGIDSFKIEGRMKGPEYAALVTALYKKYTTLYMTQGRKNYKVQTEDIEALMDLYNRGGFTDGYYLKHNDPTMITFDRSNHKGTCAAKIIKCQGDIITFKALENLHGQDVLEIKEGLSNQDTYAWTLKSDISMNETFTIRHRFKTRQHDQYCYRTKNQSLLAQVQKTSASDQFKEKINGKLRIFKDLPAKLEIKYGEFEITVEGQIVQTAMNRAMTEQDIRKHMMKTGDTPYVFESLDILMDDDIFMPVASLKQLRRDAIELLEKCILESFSRTTHESQIENSWTENEKYKESITKTNAPDKKHQTITVLISSMHQFEEILKHDEISRIYINDGLALGCHEEQWQQMIAQARRQHKELYLALPSIIRHEQGDKVIDQLKSLGKCADGILVRSVEGFLLFDEDMLRQKCILDCNVYTWNSDAKHFWNHQGICAMTVPEELNYRELQMRDCDGDEMIVYGYRPLMTTAQCLTKTTDQCLKQDQKNLIGWLTDRKGKRMMVQRHCSNCYNTIYNSQVLMLLDELAKIQTLGVDSIRLEFTIESQSEMKDVLKAYIPAWLSGVQGETVRTDFTKGHFKRGVE